MTEDASGNPYDGKDPEVLGAQIEAQRFILARLNGTRGDFDLTEQNLMALSDIAIHLLQEMAELEKCVGDDSQLAWSREWVEEQLAALTLAEPGAPSG